MQRNGAWILDTLYRFSSGCGGWCAPQGRIALDGPGNIHGTTTGDGLYRAGNVFKPTLGNNAWVYISLHYFTGQSGRDGAYPEDGPVLDTNGNIYGTASEGCTYNQALSLRSRHKISPLRGHCRNNRDHCLLADMEEAG